MTEKDYSYMTAMMEDVLSSDYDPNQAVDMSFNQRHIMAPQDCVDLGGRGSC
ncbi:hypothetical protein PO909_000859 [Leuciscus waleckii]